MMLSGKLIQHGRYSLSTHINGCILLYSAFFHITYNNGVVFRLLVNLTQPAILCFKDAKERKDPEFPKCYGEVVDCLHSYKEVIMP